MPGWAADPPGAVLRLDAAAPALKPFRVAKGGATLKARLFGGPRPRHPMHAVLADEHGVWAWPGGEPHAAAVRYASLEEWIEMHADGAMRLWASGQLVRSLQYALDPARQDDPALRARALTEFVACHGGGAAGWALATWTGARAQGACALAGIDLQALAASLRRHRVRMQSLMPWWAHAFVEAKRCVNALAHVAQGQVCVVEGRSIVWIGTSHGRLCSVRQHALEDACVDALGSAIRAMTVPVDDGRLPPVVLGHGLRDGARAHELDALVLGRLDGLQPPQWLRPDLPQEA